MLAGVVFVDDVAEPSQQVGAIREAGEVIVESGVGELLLDLRALHDFVLESNLVREMPGHRPGGERHEHAGDDDGARDQREDQNLTMDLRFNAVAQHLVHPVDRSVVQREARAQRRSGAGDQSGLRSVWHGGFE